MKKYKRAKAIERKRGEVHLINFSLYNNNNNNIKRERAEKRIINIHSYTYIYLKYKYEYACKCIKYILIYVFDTYLCI